MKRLIIPCLVIQSKLLAASATWVSTSSSSMAAPGNWSPGGTPASGTQLVFPPLAGIQFSVTDDLGPFTLQAITGNANSLSIVNNGTTAYTITPSGAAVFNVPSTGSQTSLIVFGSSSGSLASILAVPINLNGGTLNLIGSAAYDRITGGITGSGTLQVAGGTIQISGANTYSGTTNINAGTLRLGAGSSLPSGTTFTVASGGIFDLNGQTQTFTSTPAIGGTVKTGTGSLSVPGVSGSGIITINTGGTFKVTTTASGTLSAQMITGLAGAGGTFELGAGSVGVLSVTGANAYSTQTNIGYTTVSGGTLQSGNASAFGTNSNLAIAMGATLDLNNNTSIFNTLMGAGALTLGTANATVNSGANNTFSGSITGTGSSQFIYAGSDKLTLSGTFSIPTVAISGGGTLNVVDLAGISNSILFETATNGTLQFSSGFMSSVGMTISPANANLDTMANSVTLNGNLSGGGSLTKKGTGTLTLGGVGNAYTGGTIVSQGTVEITSSSAYPPNGTTGTALSINSGATFDMQGNSITISTLSGSGTLSMGAGTATVTVGGTTFSGAINGGGGLIYFGNATTLTLSGTNGYMGTTEITGTGTLNVVQSAFNTTTGLTFDVSGGTLQAGNPLTNSIDVTLSANGTIDTNGHDCTFSGKITGSSGFTLTKQGAGTLLLDSMMSDYMGQTNVFAGTLQAGSASAFGATSALNIKTDATVDLNNNNLSVAQLLGDTGSSLLLGTGTLTITGGVSTGPFYGVISGGGDVVLDGGEPTFMGVNTYSGTTTIQNGASFNAFTLDSTPGDIDFAMGGGTLTIGSTTTTSSAINLNDVATIATNTFNLIATGQVTGSASQFTKLGSGTLYLNPMSANDFTSTPLSIQGGTVQVTANGLGGMAQQPASIAFLDFCGTLQIDDPLTISSPMTVSSIATIDTNGNPVTISSNISKPSAASGLPSGGLEKAGAGVLTLTGTNDYTAPTTISGGTLNAGSSSLPLPTMSFIPTLVFSGDGTGIFQAGSVFASFPVVILNQSGTFDTPMGNDITLDNIIAGSATASLTKTGAGVMTLTALNLYTGQTIIEDGTLNVTATSLPASSGIVFSGAGSGILQAGNPMPAVVNSITFLQNGTIDTNGNDVTISGILSGASGNSFTKKGMNTLTLSGANTYFGPTLVNEGTLRAGIATSNSGAFGENSDVTVAMGATLDFDLFANNVASLINNGDVKSSETITTGTFSQSSTGASTFDFPSSSPSPVGNVSATGAITLDGTLTVTNTGGFSGGSNVILFQSSGTGKQLIGAFTATTVPFGSIHYDYSQNQVILGAGSTACSASWNTGTGNWGAMANWTSCTPGISGNNNDSAAFPTGAGAAVITLANSIGTAPLDVTLQYLDFNSTTPYTIQQFMGAGSITIDDLQSTTPNIHVILGAHTIDAPIILNQDARFMISSGSLTLGSAATLSSTTGSWSLSEGSGSGTLFNFGTIAPASLLIEGNIIENNSIIHPAGSFSISGLGGSGGATVNNHGTLTADSTFLLGGSAGDSTLTNDASQTVSSVGAFTIGDGAGTTILTNSGIVSSGSTLTVNSGTVTNNSGGLISSTGTFAIAGGSVTNDQGGTLGSSTANLVYSGGSLTSSDNILVKDYTQSTSNPIILNLSAAPPFGKVSATGAVNLAGGLTVTSSYMPGMPAEVILFQSTGSGKQLHGTFTSPTLPMGTTLHYDYSENEVILAFAATCDGTWTSTMNGDWGAGGNWTPCVPGVGGMASDNDTATFPTVAAMAVDVTLADATGTMPQNVLLHDLTFDSATSYAIQQFMGATVTLDGTISSKPKITVVSGNHSINAPLILNQDARFILSSGSLTLGVNATITSSGGTWNLSEGTGHGVLNNLGLISPTNLLVEGNILNNNGTISPSGTFDLSGLDGISNPATLNNNGTLSSGGAFTVGGGDGETILNNNATVTSGSTFTVGSGTGVAVLNNNGTIQAASTFTISSGSVNNNSNSAMAAGSGSTMTISGGSVTNNTNGTLGSSTANLVFSGGTLLTAGNVLANTYTQSGSATLQTNVTSLANFGKVIASGAGTVGGNLIVYADPNISLVHGNTVNLITAAGGRNAQFAHVSFQNFPPSLIPSLVYLNNAVQLDIRGTNPKPIHGSSFSVVFNSIAQHNSFITLQMMHMRDRMSKPTTPIASKYMPYSVDELLAENEEVPLAAIEDPVIAQEPGIIQKPAQLSQRVEREGFPWSAYAGPIATFGHVKSKGAQLGLGYTSAGGLAGFDKILEDTDKLEYRMGFGAIVEYRKIWATVLDHGGSTSTNRVHGSVYGTAIPKTLPDLAIELIAGFAFNWDKLHRNTGIAGELTAHASTTETIGDILLGFEYTFSGNEQSWLPCGFAMIPLLTWQYVVDSVAGYTESGAGIFDLQVSSYHPMSLTSVLGSRFQYLFRGCYGDLRLEVDAGWQREYLNRSLRVTSSAFTISSGSTTTTTMAPGRNSLILALDLLGINNGGWTVEFNTTYQLNSLYYDVFFYLGFGREF